ncbi:MAG: hypothetical protein EOO85_25115 [Pedobacter sp.]|nr:MAG: hypothetical protein EOO85_25115 [Pedobacter sp.]
MEDRDFDQLFKDQFEEAEVTPSANLWGNIEKELSPKKKVVLPAYWMAAAVVAMCSRRNIIAQDSYWYFRILI